jgi:hypothetical protein
LEFRVGYVRRISAVSHFDAAHHVALVEMSAVEELAIYSSQLLGTDAILKNYVLVHDSGSYVVKDFVELE